LEAARPTRYRPGIPLRLVETPPHHLDRVAWRAGVAAPRPVLIGLALETRVPGRAGRPILARAPRWTIRVEVALDPRPAAWDPLDPHPTVHPGQAVLGLGLGPRPIDDLVDPLRDLETAPLEAEALRG